MTDKIHILMVDDHQAFRDGLRAMLTLAPDVAADGRSLVPGWHGA